MGIKKYKPTTPSLRQMTVSTFEEIDKVTPEKSLLRPLHSKAGRNSYGRITVRHRGCGAKRKYRIIDFKRYKDGMELFSPLSMILTEVRISRCFNMKTVQKTISSHPLA